MSRKLFVGCVVAFCSFPIMQAGAQGLYNYETGRVENAGSTQNNGYSGSQQQASGQNEPQAWGYGQKRHFYSGDWSLTLGGTVYSGPKYMGADTYQMKFSPIFSLGKSGPAPKFASRNDNPSFAFYENDILRLGATGKILWHRDGDTSSDLDGLDPVKWGLEAGAFAELFPVDGLRIRTELRHGIRTHDAFTLDVAMDLYHDITPTLRLSGGPRAFYAGQDYFKTYYGVNTREAERSGLKKYSPDSGWGSFGVGGALTWKTTDKITTSIFGEYNRLQGPASDSSLVRERGSKDQVTVGVSASYRFDFHLD